MAEERRYTTTQLAVAARELREAAGAEEQTVTGVEAIEMLDDEIRLLRERGFSDEQIASLLTGFDIEVTTEQIAKHAPPAL
jgi:microsomal dipeptidase-like Zn-dependent dipeptidase